MCEGRADGGSVQEWRKKCGDKLNISEWLVTIWSAKSYIQVLTEVAADTWIFIGVPLLWYALLSADIGVLQVLDSCLESNL